METVQDLGIGDGKDSCRVVRPREDGGRIGEKYIETMHRMCDRIEWTRAVDERRPSAVFECQIMPRPALLCNRAMLCENNMGNNFKSINIQGNFLSMFSLF